MDYKCVSCEMEWEEEYLINMEERMFRGKRTPDMVYIEGSWYHRYCASEGNLELGKIVKITVEEDVENVEEEDEEEEQSMPKT